MKRSDTVVVLGNGPSLRGFDFDRLRPFESIGMNAAYRYWEEIGWYPTYYIRLDTVVGVLHNKEIARLIRESEPNRIKVFLLRRNLIDLLPNDIRDKSTILDFDPLKNMLPIFNSTKLITTVSHGEFVGQCSVTDT